VDPLGWQEQVGIFGIFRHKGTSILIQVENTVFMFQIATIEDGIVKKDNTVSFGKIQL
jgi:hypothetical protein